MFNRLYTFFLLVLFGSLSGCAHVPSLEELQEGSSWARRVSMHSTINPGGGKIKDAQVDLSELHEGRLVPRAGLDNVALAGGFALAPAGGPGRVGALDALLFLDMLSLGAGTPNHPMYQDAALAWMPVELASSPEEAQRVFRKVRADAVAKALDELGVVYKHRQSEWRQSLFGGAPVLGDVFIPEDGIPGVCEECYIRITTAMPDKKPVMSPVELTGESYLSYQFNARIDKGSRSGMTSRLVLFAKMPAGGSWARTGMTHWIVRDFEALKWLSGVNPDWAVMYLPAYRPEWQADADSGDFPGGNPFPFMVHKGQVRFFVEGDN